MVSGAKISEPSSCVYRYSLLACNCIDTAFVENAVEELESHDGEDDDEEHDEQHDVEERDHRHDDCVDDNL